MPRKPLFPASPLCADPSGASTTVPPDTETETVIIPDEDVDELLDQPWHVVIYDDPVNLMSYVTMVIRRVFGYPEGTAERMMMEVHTKGKSIVWTGDREKAELYVQQLQSYQLLAAMKKAG
jgi:ATP-dependent Clp protease adaptor protein ClpS